MKIFTGFMLFLLHAQISCSSQSLHDIETEVVNQFKDSAATVSAILSDKKYTVLHPETSFRELIRKYSDTSYLKIVTDDEPGKKIKVLIRLKDANHQPIPNYLVYLYQTDARGWYAAATPHVGGNEGDMRHARLFGYAKTNGSGEIVLYTVKPSGYPNSDLPAHIHVHFEGQGYQSNITELLFDDDTRLAGTIREQAVKQRYIIALPEKIAAPFMQLFSYTIVLQKK